MVQTNSTVKAVALIDGEHYPPVLKSALEDLALDYEVVGAVFLGGTEKVGSLDELSELGFPIVKGDDYFDGLHLGIDEFNPQMIVDLSDEPILGYRERFLLANHALARGVGYRGADFQFSTSSLKEPGVASLSVGGTGKRTGKTAVSAYIARILKETYRVAIVTMGRGGPSEPEVLEAGKLDLDPRNLVELAKSGRHAASDHYEDALMARVMTVGCRRCGGGLSGSTPYFSNVEKGIEIVESYAPDLAIFEGSGSTLPPIIPNRQVMIVGAGQPIDYIKNYFGPYRILRSDLAVLTMCEKPMADPAKVDKFVKEIKEIKDIPVVETVFRPRPLEEVAGEKVFLASTAPLEVLPKLESYLEEEHNCSVVGSSPHLSNRPLLRKDLTDAGLKFDTLLVEVKAAGIDVGSSFAIENDRRVVFVDNIPIPRKQDLKALAFDLGRAAIGEQSGKGGK